MTKKGKTWESTGSDNRSAAEIRAQIESDNQVTEAAPAQAPTPSQPEPVEQEAPPAPESRPKIDDDTGLPLVYAEPESATEAEPAPETETRQRKYGNFETPEALHEGYENLRRAYDKEHNNRRDLEGKLQSLSEDVAEMRGRLHRPEPEPRAQEPTDEQLAELLSQDPGRYARYIKEDADRRATARVRVLEDQLELDRTQRMQQERSQYALSAIPEVRAAYQAKEKGTEVEPQHVAFITRFTEIIQQYPDLAQSNDKMDLAAKAVRMELYAEQVKRGKVMPSRSSARAPRTEDSGDVFLESTSGRAATSPKKEFAQQTAAEMKKSLQQAGVPVVDRG